MIGPYTATIRNHKKIIDYKGNKLYPSVEDIGSKPLQEEVLTKRLDVIVKQKEYYHIHKIDNAIFFSTVDFFRKRGAEWCNLPLTTFMISSPGEVYAGKTLDYTTDTLPVELSWFKNERKIFLSESSQFYLELRLLIDKVDKVFSIYNSFRKEDADFSHLTEFQHIEFEGKVNFKENVSIFLDLLRYITKYIATNNRQNLLYFLSEEEIDSLIQSFDQKRVNSITLKEALQLLFDSTNDSVYHKFSLKYFGPWEEIKLTELLKGHVMITEFPILQIPFYHNAKRSRKEGPPLAENADLILYGYREVIGSGTRISNIKLLRQKAKIFNLPIEDYEPYLSMRRYKHYRQTSGFGFGWQRYVHWLLKLPYIWESTHTPRTHYLPRP